MSHQLKTVLHRYLLFYIVIYWEWSFTPQPNEESAARVKKLTNNDNIIVQSWTLLIK